jgi:hypothetical protein
VEFYIPLINAKGYISVFWFEENTGTIEDLVNRTTEKIRAASVQLGDIKSTGTMKVVDGRWKNLVLGSGPIKYRIMSRDGKIYLIVEAVNAGERREVEREAMIALDLIADTFTA